MRVFMYLTEIGSNSDQERCHNGVRFAHEFTVYGVHVVAIPQP